MFPDIFLSVMLTTLPPDCAFCPLQLIALLKIAFLGLYGRDALRAPNAGEAIHIRLDIARILAELVPSYHEVLLLRDMYGFTNE